jgi:hypothetical protein
MEAKATESLLNQAREYGKVTYELHRLKIVDKASDLTSGLFYKFLFFSCMLVVVFSVNIGVGLWLGKLLGANYLGFLVIALFYGFIGIGIYLTRSWIKSKMHNYLIRNILNKLNGHENHH